jgi:integrase
VEPKADRQMPILKLTQLAVERGCKPPANGRVEYWDSQLPGFGLRVAAPLVGREARKTWQVMYYVNGRRVRETLGTVATIPKIDAARMLARESLQRAERGIHPTEERRREREEEKRQVAAEEARQRDTLGAVIDRYLERYAVKRMRPDYFKETKRTLEVDVKPALGHRPIREIRRPEIRELLGAIVGRGRAPHASHVLAYLRAMLNWAVAEEMIDTSPAAGVPDPDPRKRQDRERDRYLDDDEIRLFWLACDKLGWPFGPLFKLLLLTGSRRDELAHATWSEIDTTKGLWSLPRERVKNDKEHVLHLSVLAVEIIEALPKVHDRLVFTTNGERPVSGFGRARERLAGYMLDALAERDGKPDETIKPFTLHDLRRTAATGMAALGIAHHVVDRILNHTAGKISGVARIYNRNLYLAERKTALEAWARHVDGLVRPVPSNVEPLRRSELK